jgi:hypothetical protein
VNRDWGYQYLSVIPDAANVVGSRVGAFTDQRTAFISTGKLPVGADNRQPRAANVDMPTMAVTADFTVQQGQDGSMVVMVAYDDIASVLCSWQYVYPHSLPSDIVHALSLI